MRVHDIVRVRNGSGQTGEVVQLYNETRQYSDVTAPYTEMVAVVCPPIQNGHYWLAEHLEVVPACKGAI